MTKVLDELLDYGEQRGKEMIGTKRELIPYWLLVHEDGRRMLIATPWENSREKYGITAKLRKIISTGYFIAYSFHCEGWMLNIPPGEPIPDIAPSESPNRIECFMVTACDGTKEIQRTWEIKRGPDGTCVDLVHFSTSEDIEGRLTNFFKA